MSLPTRMCCCLPPCCCGCCGFAPSCAPAVADAHSTTMVKMEWEREEVWFMSVAPVARLRFPRCSTRCVSSADLTT